ncbi:MAG: hypothetical protein GC155_14395 [Alphaproteobacteria bacterium]|nr:hypothetical protein [Alphaproteobacteria bacterium]
MRAAGQQQAAGWFSRAALAGGVDGGVETFRVEAEEQRAEGARQGLWRGLGIKAPAQAGEDAAHGVCLGRFGRWLCLWLLVWFGRPAAGDGEPAGRRDGEFVGSGKGARGGRDRLLRRAKEGEAFGCHHQARCGGDGNEAARDDLDGAKPGADLAALAAPHLAPRRHRLRPAKARQYIGQHRARAIPDRGNVECWREGGRRHARQSARAGMWVG